MITEIITQFIQKICSKLKKQRKTTSKFNYSSNLEKSLDSKKLSC